MKIQLTPSSFLVSILLINISCRKAEASFMNNGIITGPDIRACVCCGGLMITFTGNPQPYAAEFKRIENVDELGITDKDKFPIYVKVDWRTDSSSVCGFIIITRMVRK